MPGWATATPTTATQSLITYTPIVRAELEPRVCLNTALLDLPIQPTTEVLGFGLGSSSAQHLPFRFYDQCRRGSSDPTVQRSVFASVDRVPGKPPAAPPPVPSRERERVDSRTFCILSICKHPFSSQKPSFLELTKVQCKIKHKPQKEILAFPLMFHHRGLVFQRFV